MGADVYVTGTAFDPDAGDAVEAVYVSVDGDAWVLATGTTSWSVLLDLSAYEEGTHVLTAYAWDGDSLGAHSVLVLLDLPGDVDLAIAPGDVVVERRPIVTDFGSVPNVANEQRRVHVTVRNLGTRDARHVTLELVARAEGNVPVASFAYVDDAQDLTIPAGGSLRVTLVWDTTATVGDVRLTASAYGPGPEPDWSNNAATIESWVRVGGVNQGFTR